MRSKILAALVALGSAGFIAPGHADTITSVGFYGEGVTFGIDPFSIMNGFSGKTYNAGEIQLTTSTNAVVDAWCIDLFHNITIGGSQSLTYVAGPLVGASTGNGGVLNAAQAKQIAGLVNYGNGLVAGGGNTDQAAGVQMAIWATEYSGVTFVAPAAAVADELADLLLAPTLTGSGLSYTSTGGSQGLAIANVAILEPASLGVLDAGLLGLCMLYRRKRALT